MYIDIYLFIKSFVSIQNDKRKTSHHYCHFMNVKKSLKR